MNKQRIAILDGFRAVAILMVLFFHYFSRWTPPLCTISFYPYKNTYDYFRYGYLGVQFFFMISGFVISLTLENTVNFNTFWKKRFIRLLPSIILASLITFIVFRFFDHDNLFPTSHGVKNGIVSITLISPVLVNKIFNFHNTNLNYINGSYWSLWPEIQFYFLSSVIYFANKRKFIINYTIVSTSIITANYIIENIIGNSYTHISIIGSFLYSYSKWVQPYFNIIDYLPFFSLGVMFNWLYKKNLARHKIFGYAKLYITILIVFSVYKNGQLSFYNSDHLKTALTYLFEILMFFIFIYKPKKLFFFENPILTIIGESSYFLYLIHERIGVLIIYSFGQYFLPFGFILPLFIIFFFVILSRLYHNKIEKRIIKRLRQPYKILL